MSLASTPVAASVSASASASSAASSTPSSAAKSEVLDPAVMPTDRNPDAVLVHVSRSSQTEFNYLHKELQDEAEALMGLPKTSPSQVKISDHRHGWRFMRPGTPAGQENPTLNFPRDHPLGSDPATKSRYVWYRKSHNLYVGFLTPQAIAHNATLKAAALTPVTPVASLNAPPTS